MSVRATRNLGAAVLAGGLIFTATGVWAQSDSGLPDAQVESNVLKALATAPDLSTQNIQSSTVYGTVTLTGNVQNDTLRTTAENLAARADGVKKVVDELTIGDTPPPQAGDQAAQGPPQSGEQPDGAQGNQSALQPDGSYAPAPNGAGASSVPPNSQDQNPQDQNPQDQNAQNGAEGPPPPQDGYQQGPPQQGPPQGRQPLYPNGEAPPNGAPIPGGQQAGMQVTIAPGSMLRIRIDRGLDSNHIHPGTNFDGTVLTDVVADGAVAIPRGASVTGTVVNAKKAGVFKGEGELSLQINSLTLGGRVYPLNTNVWVQNGRDKTAGTVAHTAGSTAVGALFGAVIGGGRGAAIGAGVGAGAGLAGSAATPRGQVIVPPESVLTFTIADPATVRTVSEQEMQRLSFSAGPPQGPPPPPPGYYRPYGYYGPQ